MTQFSVSYTIGVFVEAEDETDAANKADKLLEETSAEEIKSRLEYVDAYEVGI
jgi:hypothetical protein